MTAGYAQPLSEAEQQLRGSMVAFGFRKDDAVLYSHILRCGSVSFQQLLIATRIEPDCLRAALRKLVLLCLISEQRDTERTRFVAISPAQVWDALMFDTLWRTATDAVSGLHVMPMPGEARAAGIAAIRSAAIALVPNQGKSPFWYRKNFDDTDQFALACSGALYDARTSVVSAERPPRLPQTALFWPAIVACCARGVRYTRYATVDEIFVHGIDIVTRDTKDMRIDLRIAPAAAFSGSMFLVDDTTLFIFGTDSGTAGFSARQSRNPAVVERHILRKLAPLAAAAVPFAEVIGHVIDHVETPRSEIARAADHTVFDLVARLGRFAVIGPDQRASAEALAAQGLLQPVPGGYAVAFASNRHLAALI
ncbi:MAG: hypothetical protein C0524_11870 [Rhodobacter sp.]|nr:hypothetical protein [Rhodobacter sp.]